MEGNYGYREREQRTLSLHEHRKLRKRKRTLADARRMRAQEGRAARKTGGLFGNRVKEISLEALKKVAEEPQQAGENGEEKDVLFRAGVAGWEAGGGPLFHGGTFLTKKDGKAIAHPLTPKKASAERGRRTGERKNRAERTVFAKGGSRKLFGRKRKAARRAQQSAEATRRSLIKAEQLGKQAAKSAAATGKGIAAAFLKLMQLGIKLFTMLIGLLVNFLIAGGWFLVLLILVVLLVLLAGSVDFSKDFDADGRGKYYVAEGTTLEAYIQDKTAHWAEGLFADPEEAVLVFYGTGSGELTIDWDACLICFAVYCDGNYKEGDTLTPEDVSALDAMIAYFSVYEQSTEQINFSAAEGPAAGETADGIWSMATKEKLSAAPEGEQQARVITLLEPDMEKLYQVFEFDEKMREDCKEALAALKKSEKEEAEHSLEQ